MYIWTEIYKYCEDFCEFLHLCSHPVMVGKYLGKKSTCTEHAWFYFVIDPMQYSVPIQLFTCIHIVLCIDKQSTEDLIFYRKMF